MAKSSKASKKTEQVPGSSSLEQALNQIEKQFGEGTIMHLDESSTASIPGISTGALSLDIALGGRGMPRGRVVELFGPEASGKTTIALHTVAEAQKTGGVAAFIDAEHALDPTWAKKIGVNLDALLFSQPDSGEDALNIVEMLVRSDAVDVIVVDSVAALIPQAELQGEMGDTHVGLQARLMSQAMRKLTGAISKSRTCLIFINQIRMKIGVMFGNPETTPGGNALKFYSSVRLDIRKISTIKDSKDGATGNRIRARVVKNKVAPPFRQAEFDIFYDQGISEEGDLIDLAVNENILDKSGAFIKYEDETIGRGMEKAREYMRDNPEFMEKIRHKVLVAYGVIEEDKPETIKSDIQEIPAETVEEAPAKTTKKAKK